MHAKVKSSKRHLRCSTFARICGHACLNKHIVSVRTCVCVLHQATQDLVEQRLSKRVTFAMGMFPISSLGRTAGRRRFRPVYQRFRRTRSTASDTALGDAYGELTIGSTSVAGAYTLPPNLHFPRRSTEVSHPYCFCFLPLLPLRCFSVEAKGHADLVANSHAKILCTRRQRHVEQYIHKYICT